MKIPDFVHCYILDWQILPHGIHDANLTMIKDRYAINPHRSDLFDGLLEGARLLKRAGCKHIYLNGSYVTEKPDPSDFDACWDPSFVNYNTLWHIFPLDNWTQKERFGGEFYDASNDSVVAGRNMLDFFQYTRKHKPSNAEVPKGIVKIDISVDTMV